MEESKPGTNILRQKNMRVFAIGAFIAILGALLAAFTVLVGEVLVGAPIDVWLMLAAVIAISALVIPVTLIQLIIGLIFNHILSPGDIEISGVKMWLFYAFEFLIGFALLTWCKQSAFW